MNQPDKTKIAPSYQASLAIKIAKTLPEYRYSDSLGEILSRINETEARYLYKLAMSNQRDELKKFIEAHI
jgi:glutaredoxin-related protein